MPARKISDTLCQVSVQITAENRKVLDYIAKKQVTSLSAVVRSLIDSAAREIDPQGTIFGKDQE